MKSTFAKRFFRAFGSVKLAVVVLSVLSAVLIGATLYESETSTRQVQALVYQSWWFAGLLFLLGLNVFCAAMVRYPWKGYQLGFVITHLGIITLLLGAIVGLMFGVEGTITLSEGGPPSSTLNLGYEVLQVKQRDTARSISAPLNLERRPLGPGKSRRLSSGGLPVDLLLTAYYPNTKDELVVQDGGKAANPAVRFTFDSPMGGMEGSGMKTTDWLVANDPQRQSVAMGPALFRMETVDSPGALQRRLQPPPPPAANEKGTLKLSIGGQDLEIPVADYLGKEFKSQDGKITVKIQNYFADFRMDTANKKPMSVSDQPNNPAVLFEAHAGEGQCVGFAFADFPEMNILRNTQLPNQAVRAAYVFDRGGLGMGVRGGFLNTITVLAGPGDQLHYTSRSTKSGFHSGELLVGQAVSPGWHFGAEFKIEQFYPRASLSTRVAPAPPDPNSNFSLPGVQVQLRQNNQSQSVLVRWGHPSTATLGSSTFDLAYHYATVPLNFTIQLQKFAAPRYEGTTMPAGFESHVRVKDAQTDEAFEKTIWMNHPMTYHGYRLSQASYEEGTGGQSTRSTLQVLRDPGWPLKWTGSILIIVGIITMFYIKPHLNGRQKHELRQNPDSANPPPVSQTADQQSQSSNPLC
ncbi:MAG: cytochrome c biogenesis protein ResB [Candidatus Omnitrophica bacterium]|nr:cytochrome c biogenesis protein ResB [Candidatus Omnitrophota bacterium]